MSEITTPPKGASWVTPYIIVSNIDEMMAFYEKAFNFEMMHRVEGEDGSACHAEIKYQDQMLMLGKAGAYNGTTKPPIESGVESPMNLYLYCKDVDAFYKNAVKIGATSLGAPEDMFWGDRMCRLKDPDGYVWCFATHVGEHQHKHNAQCSH